MSPADWGRPTWHFFHVLAARIKPDAFERVGQGLLALIREICKLLPCPECAVHAGRFWSRVRPGAVRFKRDFIAVLHDFHNRVNARKQHAIFPPVSLRLYHDYDVVPAFAAFLHAFHTHGNLNMINQSFHRARLIATLQRWMREHLNCFEHGRPRPPSPPPAPPTPQTQELPPVRDDAAESAMEPETGT
jgi:hypothetical protein